MGNNYIVHVEIPYTDRPATANFYEGVFGWEHFTDDKFDYTMFRAEPGRGGGYVKAGENGINVGDVIVYFNSDDIDADAAKIEQLGGKVVQPKMAIPGNGYMLVFTDPTGNRLALWQNDPSVA